MTYGAIYGGAIYGELGAEERTRTSTSFRTHEPESCASANSATSAREERAEIVVAPHPVKRGRGGSPADQAGSGRVRPPPIAARASARRATPPPAPVPASKGDTEVRRPDLARRASSIVPEHQSPERRARSRGPPAWPGYRRDQPRTSLRVDAMLVFLRYFASEGEDRAVLIIGPVFGVQYVRNIQI